MSSKTIWCICKYAAPEKYGFATRHFQLTREWVKQGHRCRIISSNSSHLMASLPRFDGPFFDEVVDGVDTTWLNVLQSPTSGGWRRIASWLHFEWRLVRLDWEELPRPDVVIVSSLSLLTIVTGARIARAAGARLVFEVRDIWPLTAIEIGGYPSTHPGIVALARVEEFGYRAADVIVGTMPNLVEHVRSVCPEAAVKVHCIPQGVRLSRESPKTLAVSRADHLVSDAFRIGYAGGMNLANPLETLLEAARLLDGENVEVHLLGKGTQLPRLKELGRGGSNIYFHEPVARSQVAGFLERMDVCYDSFDSAVGRFGLSRNKWIDYMSAGKPIICAFDGYRSMIDEADAGAFVPFGDARALADEIRRLRDLDRDQLRSMGARGRAFLEEHRSFELLAAEYARLF